MIDTKTTPAGGKAQFDGPLYGLRFLTAPVGAKYALNDAEQLTALNALFSASFWDAPLTRLRVDLTGATEDLVVQLATGASDDLTGAPTIPAKLNNARQHEVQLFAKRQGFLYPQPLETGDRGGLFVDRPAPLSIIELGEAYLRYAGTVYVGPNGAVSTAGGAPLDEAAYSAGAWDTATWEGLEVSVVGGVALGVALYLEEVVPDAASTPNEFYARRTPAGTINSFALASEQGIIRFERGGEETLGDSVATRGSFGRYVRLRVDVASTTPDATPVTGRVWVSRVG